MFLIFVLSSFNCYLRCDSALRVYGGRDARKNEFPFAIRIEHQVEKKRKGEKKTEFTHLCTGSALTPSWILSARHCASEEDFKIIGFKLVARYNSHFPEHRGVTRPIFGVKNHPIFTHVDDLLYSFESHMKNDICLFRSENIIVDNYAKLSAVDYKSLIGLEAYSLGFGRTVSIVEKPLQVLKGMLYDCSEVEGYLVPLLCLAPSCGTVVTICGGDSGGPVVHSSGIIGVNSLSDGNCNENTTSLNIPPGTASSVIAVVSPILDWISNVIGNKTLGQ